MGLFRGGGNGDSGLPRVVVEFRQNVVLECWILHSIIVVRFAWFSREGFYFQSQLFVDQLESALKRNWNWTGYFLIMGDELPENSCHENKTQ